MNCMVYNAASCFTQLCATRYGRDVCRQKKVYPILRELHKWEKVEDLEKPIYDLVCSTRRLVDQEMVAADMKYSIATGINKEYRHVKLHAAP